MIHYHGLPITPETAALEVARAGHVFVSREHVQQIDLAISVSQSFAIDNGAFSAWSKGKPIKDWSTYYYWVAKLSRFPNFDFAVIPDVIDGTEAENDALLNEWPLAFYGAAVWHMHESLDRLDRLCDAYFRVCIGSSGDYRTVGTSKWWDRIAAAMSVACDKEGYPRCKLHGLRMLNPKVFSRLPLASADSTNIGRNVGIDKNWLNGNYLPKTKEGRAKLMRERIEYGGSARKWENPDSL